MKVQAHWFVSSAMNWHKGTDLTSVLRTQRRMDHRQVDVCIYRVPLPVDAEYAIDNYRPVVEGLEYIGHANLEDEPRLQTMPRIDTKVA